ncbi:methionine--tRNA ligase subunit beta [Granulicella sibirica]|nr:methionine--tRNA ligase subunit beta [Granulicella sibirica]
MSEATEKPLREKFYLTTPIYYVNARPHIGHAYSTIVADVLARRHRLLGDDTFFLTGTDEHGQKIERSAAAAGVPPQEFADKVSAQFRSLWDRMGLTYDRYIRTTDQCHKDGVQKLFSSLYEKGFIYLSTYTGQYSIGEEMFVEGPPGTIGPDGRPTETVTEENFFFKLSSFQLPLIDLIESGGLVITPDSSRNEVLSFLRGDVNGAEVSYSASGTAYVPGALKDLSVSRSSFTWGIPVPEPAASEASQKHVIYVWLDALANYMTAVGYGADSEKEQAEFARLWPADVHLVGKEITRFHCVYWPAFLMAAGIPTPKAVTANGWLLFDNAKMSKSRGNVVRTETILDGFGDHVYGKQFPDSTKQERDLFGADVLRYFLLREIPFGQDGSFSFDAMVTRYNADLANGYGNLVSRTLAMIVKYFDGEIPFGTMDERVGFDISLNASAIPNNYSERDFSSVLQNIMNIVRSTDTYITSKAPWKVAADETRRDELKDILYTAVESVRVVTSFIHPVLPYTTTQVFLQLGIPQPLEAGKEPLWVSQKLGELRPLFPRADKSLPQTMADMEEASATQSSAPISTESKKDPMTTENDVRPDSPFKATTTPAGAAEVPADPTHPAAPPRTSGLHAENAGEAVAGSHAVTTERVGTPPHGEAVASHPFANAAAGSEIPDTPQIAIDDFVKVDLRVARIVVAERIPKADKLLRLEVDLGYETRQILSGIAEWYTPEELIGRKIVIIANLAPRKMRGLESRGMLLAASEGEHGKPVLATFGEEIAVGARLK